jgi:hypothetical protein
VRRHGSDEANGGDDQAGDLSMAAAAAAAAESASWQ